MDEGAPGLSCCEEVNGILRTRNGECKNAGHNSNDLSSFMQEHVVKLASEDNIHFGVSASERQLPQTNKSSLPIDTRILRLQ